MKQCNTCTRFLDESQFARRSDDRADGYQAHCLDCQAAKNRAHYEANLEAIRARALARKQAIRAGTYVPRQSAQLGRQKRALEPTPPTAPIELQMRVIRLTDDEERFLLERAAERGISVEQLVREIVQAAMSARRGTRRQKEV